MSSTRPAPHKGLLSNAARKAGNLDRPFNEPSIHLCVDEPFSVGHQGAFAERSLLCVQTIQHQLPAPIHECCFNHFIIRDARICLHNGSQS